MKTIHLPTAHRRAGRLLTALLGALALQSAPTLAADAWPTRALQMLVPFPAGGAFDAVARAYAKTLGDKLGQPIVVHNRAGASTTIAMAAVANAPADGYTIIYSPNTSLSLQPHILPDLTFTRESFIPLCQTFENIFLLAAGPKTQHTRFDTLIEHAKKHPHTLRYGTPGVATAPHLVAMQLFQASGVDLTDVPYRGETPMIPSLVAGDVEYGMVTTPFAISQNLTTLVSFSNERLAEFPDTPTAKELGYDISSKGYGGIYLRAGTPPEIVKKLESTCREVVSDPAFAGIAKQQNQRAEFLDSAAFSARIDADFKSNADVLKSVDLKR